MRFDERYKVYLDITAQPSWQWNNDVDSTWIEIFPHLSTVKDSIYEDELFRRYKWGKVTFRDDPFLGNNLYTTIKELSLTQEIRIKVVSESVTIRGYFGSNDCEFNDDDQVLSVTPAVLDQYSAILENNKKKVDATGGIRSYSVNYDKSNDYTTIQESHNVPAKVKATNLSEAHTPDPYASPFLNGSILHNTKNRYNIQIQAYIDAKVKTYYGESISFYFREYNSFGLKTKETLIETYDDAISTKQILLEYKYETTIEHGHYISFECEKNGTDDHTRIEYVAIELKLSATSLPHSTISIDVEMLEEKLFPLPVWTEVTHGRATPINREWGITNGVEDYFDQETGEPIVDGRFAADDFGPQAGKNATVSNNKDMNNEPIQGLDIPGLEYALDDYKYELSSVTVFEGTKYLAGLKRKRRVYATCTFSREEVLKADDGIEPDGDGWVIAPYPSGDKVLWIRKPFNGTITGWNLSPVNHSGGETAGFRWLSKQSSVKTGAGSIPFNSARTLKEFITTIYNGASDLLNGKSVESTFLWNENEADVPYYNSTNSGSNYVTSLNPNTLNNIACLHTFNLKTDTTSSESDESLLEISFDDLMSDLKNLIPDIFWFVEEDGTLRIEHIKYLDEKLKTIDIRNNPLIDETLKYKFDKTNMFETITYNTVNSSYRDFTENTEEFDRIASNSRDKDIVETKKTEYLCTDMKHCIESRNDLDNGMILIAYDENNKMINSYVPVVGSVFENGELAMSNLLVNYSRYEGVWADGKINNVSYEFIKTARTKEGEPISLKGIIGKHEAGGEVIFLTTELGIGFIKDLTLDFERGITTDIKLMYRYDSAPEGDGFVLSAGTDVWFDFDNYTN